MNEHDRGFQHLFIWCIVTRLTFAVNAAEVVGASVSLLCVFKRRSVLLAPSQELAHILSDFHWAPRILKRQQTFVKKQKFNPIFEVLSMSLCL